VVLAVLRITLVMSVHAVDLHRCACRGWCEIVPPTVRFPQGCLCPGQRRSPPTAEPILETDEFHPVIASAALPTARIAAFSPGCHLRRYDPYSLWSAMDETLALRAVYGKPQIAVSVWSGGGLAGRPELEKLFKDFRNSLNARARLALSNRQRRRRSMNSLS